MSELRSLFRVEWVRIICAPVVQNTNSKMPLDCTISRRSLRWKFARLPHTASISCMNRRVGMGRILGTSRLMTLFIKQSGSSA